MFSTPQTLERRTGENGVGRFDYLKQLVNEFKSTDSDDYKLQILANLANFAYDPINFEYFRRLIVRIISNKLVSQLVVFVTYV